MSRPTYPNRRRVDDPVRDRDWARDAACLNVANHDAFFPVARHGTGYEEVQAETAKAICAGCPARLACLEWAYSVGDEWAILGGMTVTERRAARRRDARAADRKAMAS